MDHITVARTRKMLTQSDATEAPIPGDHSAAPDDSGAGAGAGIGDGAGDGAGPG